MFGGVATFRRHATIFKGRAALSPKSQAKCLLDVPVVVFVINNNVKKDSYVKHQMVKPHGL